MAQSVFPAPSVGGLSLRHTVTSTSTIDIPSGIIVYAILVGGGGGGAGQYGIGVAAGGAGGGGVTQGYVPSSTSVIVGTGGAGGGVWAGEVGDCEGTGRRAASDDGVGVDAGDDDCGVCVRAAARREGVRVRA